MKKIVIDVDNTISIKIGSDYNDAVPDLEIIQKIRNYKKSGFEIVISTSRNMNTHNGNIGKINAKTLPVLIEWLVKHEVPYDEIYVGKPWCGFDGFYVDDRAIRPNEFICNSYDEIKKLIEPSR
jgi:capsule biosynthesis phosphatase